ncbi:MAG TPA: DUF120 domain-containing protein [Methanocorpusculum sp.]|nr:DUF120 domain-containing protein [Methanocorpusculum sp.]
MCNIDAQALISLKKIAVMGGCRGPVMLSSHQLGELIGISQQTASRRLQLLEREKMITRTAKTNGQYVLITKKGEECLRSEFREYKRIFDPENEETYILKGKVVSGVGEGKYYMSIPHYQKNFSELCGFKPYLGTLNVKLDPQSMQIRKRMDDHEWTLVPGFKDEHRQFGEAKCVKCTINGIDCAIVAPARTHHPPEITEIISAEHLKKYLMIDDGDEIEIAVKF